VSTYPRPPFAASNGTTVRRPHEDDRPPTPRRDVAARYLSLDRFLESIHREHLSPIDLRVLLRVTDREATVRELADSMGHRPTVIRGASARLVARGLLRRRRRPTRRHHLEMTLAATASGMGALWRVTHAPETAGCEIDIDRLRPSERSSTLPPLAPRATRSSPSGTTKGMRKSALRRRAAGRGRTRH
jgi:hypothetical protein